MAHNDSSPPSTASLQAELEHLRAENRQLRQQQAGSLTYIRKKTDQLLGVMGTIPLRPEELDDASLLDLDPIGIVSDAFAQVLDHLHATNDELTETHEELQAIFDSADVGIVVLDAEQRIQAHNASARRLLLNGRDDTIGEKCHDAMCDKRVPRKDRCSFHRALERGGTYRRNDWIQHDRHYDVVATPIFDRDGNLRQMVMVYLDITERLATLEALRESEVRYRDLFENANDLIQSVSADGSFLYVNRAWRETLGYSEEEVSGLQLFQILAPDCVEHCRGIFERLLAGEDVERVDIAYQTRDGRRVELEGNVNVIWQDGTACATRGILRDVTAQRCSEREIQRNQRLESLGQLAAGIAHDFNNLLTAILNNLTLARGAPADSSERCCRLEDGERAVLRAADLARQLLTFAKGGDPIREQISLPQLVAEAASFALSGSSLNHSVAVEPELWTVEADPGQINQVIQNLVINADQATAAGNSIEVRCSNRDLGPTTGIPLPPGSYVLIEVHDDGCGIAPEQLPLIFDPYFTTKEGGSGLGLATVHSIVRKHGGHVAVESAPGNGSTFRVYLPASSRAATAEPPPVPPATGRGHILLMDDEEIIREATSELLQALGFRCTAVADGAAALARYREAQQAGEPFDAVIMDLTIPGGMGGKEAVQHLLELDPNARAIVSSGYSNDPVMANYSHYGFCAVMPKPYRADTLASVLERLLTPAAA